MAEAFLERITQSLGTYWGQVPRSYRTPLVLTSCTALIITTLAWRRKATYQPRLLPPAPKDPRLEYIAKSASSTFVPADGRRIGYAQFGDLNGRPVIVLHGILGSRLENALFEDNAKALGVRIIGIERPGIGLSAPDKRLISQKKVLDHAGDVEALAEHLNLKEYAVLGTSGGGPFALGCAYALPTSVDKPRLKAVSIVTGAGLYDMSQSWPAILVFLNRHLDLRWLLKRVFGSAPEWQMELSDDERREIMRKNFDLKTAHPADVATAQNSKYPAMVQIFLESSRQAVCQGWDGFLDDAALLSKDPGFRVQDIRADLPIQLWYGTDDTNISPKAGDETAERLRTGGNTKVELHMIPGETHGSTQVKYQKQILEDLLRAMSS